LDSASIGWFLDLAGALCQLEDTFFDGPAYANYLHASKKVDSTTLETGLMGAMSCQGIRYLFESAPGKKTLVENDAGFGYRLNTVAKYNGGGSPQRYQILELIQNLIDSISGTIVGMDPASSLAQYLLTKVRSQAEGLLTFMDQWNSELLNQCEYTTLEAWPFIGQCVRAIMNHLIKPRIVISKMEEWKSTESKARIIWAILQVHIRMDDVIINRFKSHNTITTVMSNFILKTRVSESSVADLSKKMKDLVTLPAKVTACDTEIKAMKKEISSFKAKK
jgi:hypothetical protein